MVVSTHSALNAAKMLGVGVDTVRKKSTGGTDILEDWEDAPSRLSILRVMNYGNRAAHDPVPPRGMLPGTSSLRSLVHESLKGPRTRMSEFFLFRERMRQKLSLEQATSEYDQLGVRGADELGGESLSSSPSEGRATGGG